MLSGNLVLQVLKMGYGRLCYRLPHHPQLELEIVDAEIAVGDDTADAVFRETLGLDAQTTEYGQYGRGNTSVALELDDDGITHAFVGSGLIVVELQSEVDGQTFGLFGIDEGDAPETVTDGGHKVVPCHPRRFTEEVLSRTLLKDGFERGNADSALGGLAMVVLALHLEEGDVAPDIGAHPDFRTRAVSGLVDGKHTVARGIVEIGGGILTEHLTLHTLGIVMPPATDKHLLERGTVGHELRIRTFHQTYGLHLVEGDGRQHLKEVVQGLQCGQNITLCLQR